MRLSGNANLFPGPFRGSLTSWLPVWRPPALSSAKSTWCQSRARAAPTRCGAALRDRHVGRQPVGQARASTGKCLSPSRGDAARELVGARDRLPLVDVRVWGCQTLTARIACALSSGFVRRGPPAITRPSMELCSAPFNVLRCASTRLAAGLRTLTAPARSSGFGNYVMARVCGHVALQMVEFDDGFEWRYAAVISPVSQDTPSASHALHAERSGRRSQSPKSHAPVQTLCCSVFDHKV